MNKPDMIYQFRVDLCDIKPPIWRRIQVPSSYSLFQLHGAISDAMGWDDCHLHEFIFKDSQGEEILIGDIQNNPDYPIGEAPDNQIEHREKISRYFQKPKDKGIYIYDFGDYWNHTVVLEKILPGENDTIYPRCIKGKRRCPPENVGGVRGYEEFLIIMKNPDDDEYKETMRWCHGPYDPEMFDCTNVTFRVHR